MSRNVSIALALAVTAALLWLVTSLKVGGGRPSAPEPSAYAGPVGGAEPEEPTPEPTPTEAPAEPAAATPVSKAPAAPAAAPRPAVPTTTPLPAPQKTGPVDELKARFARDPRDAAAGTLETQIEAAFKSDDVPAALLHSVTCRATVCRVETRWAPDRGIGFMSAFTRLLMLLPDDPTPRLFDTNLGVSPESAPDASGVRAVDVYIARLPQTEPAR